MNKKKKNLHPNKQSSGLHPSIKKRDCLLYIRGVIYFCLYEKSDLNKTRSKLHSRNKYSRSKVLRLGKGPYNLFRTFCYIWGTCQRETLCITAFFKDDYRQCPNLENNFYNMHLHCVRQLFLTVWPALHTDLTHFLCNRPLLSSSIGCTVTFCDGKLTSFSI